MDDQTKFDRMEAAFAAVKADRERWQLYKDAEADKDILVRMNERNKVAATDEEVEAARAKASEALTAWHSNRKVAREALDQLLEPFGLQRSDLAGLCS